MQRIANPCMSVRFRPAPPLIKRFTVKFQLTLFTAGEMPRQNAIVVAHFRAPPDSRVGKFQNGRLVFLDGVKSRAWSEVHTWRYSEIKNPAPIGAANEAQRGAS